MSQYCSLLLWLMADDGCCQFTVCSTLLRERTLIYCVRVFRLLFIDTEFRTLRLKAEDSSRRQHILNIKLKPKVRHTPCTYGNTHTVHCKDWMVFTLNYSWSNGILLTYSQSKSRLTLPNAYGTFNLLIANQWFTSAPLNLGQTGEGVERHGNPLWMRCSTDKTSPHRPQTAWWKTFICA